MTGQHRGGLPDRLREVLCLSLIGLGLYVLLSLATLSPAGVGEDSIPRGSAQNLGGVVGYQVASGLTYVLGYASWVPVLFTLLYAVLRFLDRPVPRPVLKALGVVVLSTMLSLLLAGPDGLAGFGPATPYGAGGRLGVNLSPRLEFAFGGAGRILVLIFGGLVSLLLATEWLFSVLLRGGANRIAARLQRRRPKAAQEDEPRREGSRFWPWAWMTRLRRRAVEVGDEDEEIEEDEEAEEEDEEEQEDEPEEEAFELPAAPRKPPRRRRRGRRRTGPVVQTPSPSEEIYPYPPLDLFREPTATKDSLARGIIERNTQAIERRLASFRIGASVVGVSSGPVVTQYELRLAEGVKVSRITQFEADLAAALKALSVRVVAPIPGKDTVGIEVPNDQRRIVTMRELLELYGRAEGFAIPLFLGQDVSGTPIIEDLAKMPHLLIAGTTGSGKSVCINSILLSILMTRSPQQVRLILIDPKMVELQAFRAVPHLSCEVVTNMKKAPAVLDWAVAEMEKRYALFAAAGVNKISAFNQLGREALEKRLGRSFEPLPLPHQVLVIDELADLIAVAQREVEESIQRLAQKSRAVGLHVILATQRPSTDVITGVIKANLPCQIAFKVNRKVDSRVILDCNGAEKLLGHGDMLYVPTGGHRVVRAQGTFVSEEEIRRVVDFLEASGLRPRFLPALVQTKTAASRRPGDADDLYERAAEIILGQQRGSATLIQRALAVGYTRATRLLEMMAEDGLVGPFNGSRSREVLMTWEDYRAREDAIAAELAAVGQTREAEDDEGAASDGSRG